MNEWISDKNKEKSSGRGASEPVWGWEAEERTMQGIDEWRKRINDGINKWQKEKEERKRRIQTCMGWDAEEKTIQENYK